jgi:hypothetical protein
MVCRLHGCRPKMGKLKAVLVPTGRSRFLRWSLRLPKAGNRASPSAQEIRGAAALPQGVLDPARSSHGMRSPGKARPSSLCRPPVSLLHCHQVRGTLGRQADHASRILPCSLRAGGCGRAAPTIAPAAVVKKCCPPPPALRAFFLS